MSAWERARYIPWSRIPQSSENLEAQKERIFRDLQKVTIEDELRSHDRKPSVAEDGTIETATTTQQQQQKKGFSEVPFSSMVLLRQAAFGCCIGSLTGAVFGFMDSMRTAGESQVLQKASNVAKARYLMQGTTRSATVFGVFFGGFHVAKYGIRVVADPGEIAEIGLAGVASVGALLYKPAWRASMPYAIMLILMDSFNLAMKQTTS
jgi:hypothetical protein